MKKLILIQNDYAGSGKTTLARAVSRFLSAHGVGHRTLVLSEDEGDARGLQEWIDPAHLDLRALGLGDDMPDITILEAGNGCGKWFGKFYLREEFGDLLPTLGVEMTAVISVTDDSASHDGVLEAAETYCDNVRYVTVHVRPDGECGVEHPWSHCYAARVMEMFDAVELIVPAAGPQIEEGLRARGTTLADSLLENDPGATYGPDYQRWFERLMGAMDRAKEDFFGDSLKHAPAFAKISAKKVRSAAA